MNHENLIELRDLMKNREKIEEPRESYDVEAQYDQNNNLLFRGCLINGAKNGYGKEYYPESKIIK